MIDDEYWTPLCHGTLAQELQSATLAIARDLQHFEFSDPSLTGAAGAAVLFNYVAGAFPDGGFEDTARRMVERATTLVEGTPVGASLFGGLSGFGWCMEHIDAFEEEGTLDVVDEAMLSTLNRSPWPGDYDVVNGLVGIGVYLLERDDRPAARLALRYLIDRLDELARRGDDEISWWTAPHFMGPIGRNYPEGTYNLGLAHGVPGVVAFLARACSTEFGERARALLTGAVTWLLNRRLPREVGGAYGCNDGDVRPARSAWCYGDPGVAIALLIAARAVGNESWQQTALEIARAAAARPPDVAQVIDAGLCHGSAGLGHIFNRFYQATGDQAFADAALFWFRRTVEFRQPASGMGGFLSFGLGANGKMEWNADPGFLTGAMGIALSMIAATSGREPAWDRVLLCSLAPNRAAKLGAARLGRLI